MGKNGRAFLLISPNRYFVTRSTNFSLLEVQRSKNCERLRLLIKVKERRATTLFIPARFPFGTLRSSVAASNRQTCRADTLKERDSRSLRCHHPDKKRDVAGMQTLKVAPVLRIMHRDGLVSRNRNGNRR